jgi:hypothetical protein
MRNVQGTLSYKLNYCLLFVTRNVYVQLNYTYTW